jgi:hypothetical protein
LGRFGCNMTPKKLLAELIRQGCRLAVCGNNIEVAPISQLTERVRQDIRQNKCKLMALLRAEGPLEGRVLAPGKGQQKTRRRVPANNSVRPNDDEGKLRTAPKSDVRAPMSAGVQGTRPMSPTRPVPGSEPRTAAHPAEPIQKPKRMAPLLCPRCRQLGHAHCRDCMLAIDSSLALDGNVLFVVRQPTAQDLWPWHHCKRCDNWFKAPQFPALTLCPDCVAEGAT